MHPLVRRDLPRLSQLDHVHRRRVSAFLAIWHFKCGSSLPGIARSIFALQVVQHGIAGVLGFGESFERRADDPDRATALVKRTP
jgi:hypothetical protein